MNVVQYVWLVVRGVHFIFKVKKKKYFSVTFSFSLTLVMHAYSFSFFVLFPKIDILSETFQCLWMLFLSSFAIDDKISIFILFPKLSNSDKVLFLILVSWRQYDTLCVCTVHNQSKVNYQHPGPIILAF